MDPQWRHLISWYVKDYNSLLKQGVGNLTLKKNEAE